MSFYEKYTLHYKGASFDCFLENFSTTGLLVKCDRSKLEAIAPGEYCTITLSAAPPHEIRCRVARQHHDQLGLEFST